MRCILYLRVSTEEQARHGYSLRAQEEDCCRRAVELGYGSAHMELIREEGVSGDRVDRPGLNRLRDLVAAGGIGHVVMYDPDRFARNLSLQLIVTDEILRAGAQLEFVNFQWNDTPEGRLFYSLRGAIAEYEKAKIRERTRRGRERMVQEGRLPCDPRLFGYRWNGERAAFERDPAEFAALQTVKGFALAGLSCHEIARQLARVGIAAPRGTRWHPSTIWKLLHNTEYLGVYWTGKRGGIRRSLPLEPAWDEAIARKLVEGAARHRGGAPRSTGLLSRLVYCGACTGAVRLCVRYTGGYRYYSCNRKARVAYEAGGEPVTGCDSPYWPAHLLESAVWQAVFPLLQREMHPPSGVQTAEQMALAQTIVALRRRRERLLPLYLADRLDSVGLDREEARLRVALEEADARLHMLQQATTRPWRAPNWLHRAPNAVQRQLLAAVIQRVVAGPDGGVTVHAVLQSVIKE